MIDVAVFEMMAESVHADAATDIGRSPAQPHRIARAIWGDDDAVEIVAYDDMPHTEAMLGEVRGHPRIFLRRGMTSMRGRVHTAHEFSHWCLLHGGFETLGDDAEEQAADRLAACILAPRSAFLAAIAEHGDDFFALAERFAIPQGLAALRHAEVTEAPVVLVRPMRILKRGDGHPPDALLRALADGAARLARTRRRELTDAVGVVLSRAV